jgi:hypothetical protein
VADNAQAAQGMSRLIVVPLTFVGDVEPRMVRGHPRLFGTITVVRFARTR